MHELSIAQALVEQAEASLPAEVAGHRVTELLVEVGELSGVVPAALREVFPFAAENSLLDGARLRLRKVKAKMKCRACGKKFGAWEGIGCPHCSSQNIELLQGRELRLMSMEIEERKREIRK